MPDSPQTDARRPARDAVERAADHAAIDHLAGELLPALIAKLGATGLGELEVREGDWRVRLRRPAVDAVPTRSGPGRDKRSSDRDRSERGDRSDRGDRTERGERNADRAARATQHATHDPDVTGTGGGASRSVATSPAVGVFQPRADLATGSRVRSGDRLGAVDMLGIAQEVVAPIDGVVGASLVEPGEAVEYGQELIRIEFGGTPGAAQAGATATATPTAIATDPTVTATATPLAGSPDGTNGAGS